MKADERFMAGRDAITFEIAVYLTAFFGSICIFALCAHFGLTPAAALRFFLNLLGA